MHHINLISCNGSTLQMEWIYEGIGVNNTQFLFLSTTIFDLWFNIIFPCLFYSRLNSARGALVNALTPNILFNISSTIPNKWYKQAFINVNSFLN